MPNKPIDVNLIRSLFIYHQGVLYWAVRPAYNVKVGDVAGSLNINGRWHVKIDGKNYQRSRLVYAFHNEDPGDLEVDHLNRLRNDDRIENLKKTDSVENNHNKGMMSTNTSGTTGVVLRASGNYQAKITINGNRHHKTVKTLEEGVAWRKKMKRDAGLLIPQSPT